MSSEINITNLEAGQAAVDELVKGITELNTLYSTISGNPFGNLEKVDPDLGTKFNNELKLSLSEVYDFLNSKIAPALSEYFKDDSTPDDPTPTDNGDPPPGGGDGDPPPGGGDGDPPPGGTGPTAIPTGTPPTPTDPTLPTGVTVPLAPAVDAGPLEDMDLDDLDGTVEALIALSGDEYLDKFVENDVNADKIKQMLLDSPNVPQEFKDQIKDVDSKVVRKFIEEVLKGKHPEIFDLNAVNLTIIHRYLEQVARDNGITVDQLISDPKYTELLMTTLKGFGNITELFKELAKLPPEDFQAILLKVYDGDGTSELPAEDTDIVRSFVDFIAEETEITYEELLTDKEYAEELRNAAASFGKASTFFKATSKFSEEGARENVKNLYNGSNYKAYGMTMSEADQFKTEIDNAAKANNTTPEKFLSESQYADKVREVLDNSPNCEGVGAIYKNEESSVHQEVAKNLYNTKLEETIYDSETGQYYYVTPKEQVLIPKEQISKDGLTATIIPTTSDVKTDGQTSTQTTTATQTATDIKTSSGTKVMASDSTASNPTFSKNA